MIERLDDETREVGKNLYRITPMEFPWYKYGFHIRGILASVPPPPQNNNIYPSRTRGVNIISLRLFPPVPKFPDLPALFLLDGAYVLRITPVFMTFLFSNYSYLPHPPMAVQLLFDNP